MTSTRGVVLRILFPILVPCLVSSHGFLSISLSCVSTRGGRAMWEMKRALCFPADRKSWIWISFGSEELLLFCSSLIIFLLRACLCLHIFPYSIVQKKTELMRIPLFESLYILQGLSSSLCVGMEAPFQHPKFSCPFLCPWSAEQNTDD